MMFVFFFILLTRHVKHGTYQAGHPVVPESTLASLNSFYLLIQFFIKPAAPRAGTP